MEANFFHGDGPELGRRTTTITELKKYYTKRTRMRISEEKDKDRNRQHQYTAPQEMRHEASNSLPKAATTAKCNNLPFPCTTKNDSYPLELNYGGEGGGLEQIKIGCLYELNHSLSGQNSLPFQLKSVRVVTVIARTEVNVILRFPSAASLHAHYNNTNVVVSDDRNKRIQYQHPQLMKKEKLRVHPELDEVYVMDLKLAGKLLLRQILSSEFSKQKHLKSFWTPTFQQPILASTPVQDHSGSDDYYVSDDDDNCNEVEWIRVAPMGWNGAPENYQSNLYCLSPVAVGSSGNGSNLIMRKRRNFWSALTNISDLHWGVRRRVAFMGPNRNNSNNDHHQAYYSTGINNNYTTTSNRASEHRYHLQSTLGIFGAVPKEEEEEQEQDEEEANASEMGEIMGMNQAQDIFKTKTITEDDTEQSNENNNQIVIHNKKQLVPVTSYDRWSKEMYRKAEVSMMQIMKEKDAVAGKPVLRSVLRMDAGKYIGDTGLLDHLLKHMSGKVAPDGELRFRGCHNAEGEMEYWLEYPDWVTEAGTFITGIKWPPNAPNAVLIGSDSRTTRIVGKVNVKGAEKNRLDMITSLEIGEVRSEKIHKITDFVIAAAAGNRKFNLRVKELMKFDTNFPIIADAVAFRCRDKMKLVRKEAWFQSIINYNFKISSTFILGIMDDGTPELRQVRFFEDSNGHRIKIFKCHSFTFAGDVDQNTRAYLESYLDSSLCPDISLQETKQVALHCITHATQVAEKRKIGDSSVGGWAEVWTLHKDGIVYRDFGRIKGSARLGD